MSAVSRIMIARAVLLAVFLIPIGQSSLRGLTHVLTCRRQVSTPFQIMVIEGETVIISSTELSAEGEPLCGGLSVDLSADTVGDGELELTIPISNQTGADWSGSVELEVEGTRIPLDLGRVDAGETRRRRIVIQLESDEVNLTGSLLVGP